MLLRKDDAEITICSGGITTEVFIKAGVNWFVMPRSYVRKTGSDVVDRDSLMVLLVDAQAQQIATQAVH